MLSQQGDIGLRQLSLAAQHIVQNFADGDGGRGVAARNGKNRRVSRFGECIAAVFASPVQETGHKLFDRPLVSTCLACLADNPVEAVHFLHVDVALFQSLDQVGRCVFHTHTYQLFYFRTNGDTFAPAGVRDTDAHHAPLWGDFGAVFFVGAFAVAPRVDGGQDQFIRPLNFAVLRAVLLGFLGLLAPASALGLVRFRLRVVWGWLVGCVLGGWLVGGGGCVGWGWWAGGGVGLCGGWLWGGG
ncbi:hypothetical protein OHB41_50955, partial [Streptomyces sp. NBC_01571]|uniref:hypothetical protein n=1 Tax=Streptomyces sp. NBC_01571 TaxID=2975883 RepID=UPI00224CE8DB